MKCPFCGHEETRVLDSRLAGEGSVVRRRRACQECDRRFTTYERVEEFTPMVVKKDGRREPFDPAKLIGGLRHALAKRPVSTAQVDALVAGVRQRLEEWGQQEVPSQEIGAWVMASLKELDHVAYVRYASVYRRFTDAADFADAVEGLKR